MLAKQGWRMLVNTESLAVKVLKARYFPRIDFLRSELKPTSSLIWRSIWCAKELLKRGCRHLIGDGRSTLIWGDPWIPNESQFLVQSPRPERCELQYVSDLIDEDTCTWRRELIMSTFNPHEAQLILSIPLSWMRRSDGWTWAFTRNGNYTVRSGYHQAICMRNHSVDPSSSTTSFRGRQIWVLNIPEKVRLLVWSAYRDILPTMMNLQRKRVAVDLECPMCHMDIETVNHCFMACPVARAVWLGSPLSLRVSELHADNFAGFFEAMTATLGSEQLELFCILCWKLWSCRNEALWEGKTMEPRQIIAKALSFLQEYSTALLSRGRGPASVQRRTETRWRPPDAGFVKINMDGAICAQRELYGLGAVARDSSGEVIAAMMFKGYGQISAEESEACSLRKALKWARDLMFYKVVVETDCASIVTAINGDYLSLNSNLGCILLDCKQLMAPFTICRLQHVRRSGNFVAHELARKALQAEDDFTWVDRAPEFIAHLVTGDREVDQ
ncbi:hypothetical protein SLA2020_321580 [Shorea laevis]